MVNIVILAKGRLRLTEQTLQSLYRNTNQAAFSCTVVNDGEDDFRVSKLLRWYLDFSNFTLLEASNSGHVLAQLKNLGVAWSAQRFGRGDWLYLSDGDMYFQPEWLDRLISMAEFLEPSHFRLFGGQIHPFHAPLSPPLDGCTWVSGRWAGTPYERVAWTEHGILDGPSWLMRWETWSTAGPYSRRSAPGVCQSEEYPFCERIRAVGGRIAVVSPHVTIHCGLTQTDGKDAPGRTQRAAAIPKGVLAE